MVIHNEIFDSYRLEQKSKKLKLSSQKEDTIDDLMNNIITECNKLKKLLQDQKDWEQFLINKKKKYEHSRLSISANTNARKSK